MAKGFNLTAEINLRGPANIKQVVKSIKQQLGTINANVNININSSTTSAINQINNRLNNLNQTLAATTTSANTAAQAFSNLAAAMNSVAAITLPPTVTANVNQTTTAVTNASRAVAQTRTEFEEFGRQSALAVRRFAAFSSVTSIIYGLNNAISAGISDFITFDKQITRLSQVTNESKDGLSSLAANITRLSTGLGVASKDLAEVSVTLAQAGLSASDTRTALEALAKSALAPSFDSLNETVEGSIALMRQFGISAAKLEGALGSVNAVAAAFAVEASDIITAIQRTGGVFASASKGVSEGTDSLNEFIAVFTSVRATTRESAETIATGLRTIFTRIQRADTVEALKEFGVTLTDLEGKFVGPYEAVRRLSEGLSSIDPRDLKFSQIVEELGGFRQIGKVLPLIQQFSTAQSALKIAQEGQGSLAIDAAKGQQALAVQIQKVREEFSALIRSFGDSSSFQTLVKLGLDLASALIKVADATKGVLPLVGLIAAFRGVSAITQFAGGFGQGMGGGRRQRANRGGVIHFATGGSVPGTGNRDSVPAMLTPGEFVMRKQAVKNIGVDSLNRMNRGGIQGFGGGTSGKGATGPISVAIDDVNTQASHVGKQFGALKQQEVEAYASMGVGRGKRSQKFDPEKTREAGLSASETFKLGLPEIVNQNTKSDKQGVYSTSLINWIRKHPDLLFMGKRNIRRSALQVEPQVFADQFADAIGSLGKEIIKDIDLSNAFEKVRPLLDPKYIASRSGKVDLFSNQRSTAGASQIRHEGFDVRKISNRRNIGGLIQKFIEGGIVQRRVGYIDYDVIANPSNDAIIKKGMEATGQDGPRLYTDYLTNLAVKARKNTDIQKLRAVYGVAGSGKTTLARGQGTDDARLRKTERFPILTPEDIQKATEVLVLSSSVSKNKLDEVFSQTDKTYTLSSTTEQEKKRIESQRTTRDVTGVGLEGRKPGVTASVAKDTAVGEALLSDRLGDKSVVLGRNDSGKLRRKSGDELVEVIKKKIGFTWGGFAPMTAGHESIMDAASAMGISPEDFIYLVGANEGIKAGDASSYRTAIFDQDARVLLAKAGAGAKGATVLPKPRDFEVPQAFDVSEKGGRRKVVIPAKGSATFVADKGPEETKKYKDAGYQVQNIERTGGISGTMVRELIEKGDLGKLQSVLSPGVYDLISNNIGRIQNRANILPSIIEEVNKIQGVKLEEIDKEIKTLGISRVDSKKVAADPEYAAKVEVLKELRAKRDKVKSAASFEPYKLLSELAAKQPDKYGLDLDMATTTEVKPQRAMTGKRKPQKANIGGLIQKFMAGGVAEESDPMTDSIAATKSRAEILDLLKSRPNGLQDTAKEVGVGVGEISKILGVRQPDAKTKAFQEAIRREYVKTYNRQAGAARGTTTKLEDRGLVFGAAGLLGSAGAPENIDIVSDRLSKSAKVRVVSGVMDKTIADQIDQLFVAGSEDLAEKAATIATKGKTPKGKTIPNLNAEASIQGGLIEKMVQKLGGPGKVKGQGFDFPDGLKGASQYFNLPPDIPTDVKRTLSGPSTIKDNIVTYLKNVKGYNAGGAIQKFADGGSVPALLTPGEAVIPPKMAKRIGYSKLNRMNKADQNGMGRYASGGDVGIVPGSGNTDTFGPVPLPVGSFVIRKKATEALGFNSGGKVKKFFFGGSGGPSPRPTTISPDTLGASNAAVDALRQVSDALAELGVTSTQSAQLLNRGYQATAAEARRATEADLAMARAVGASADVLFDLEEAAREANRATQAEINIRQRLGDISGGAIQDAITAIEDATRNARETERTNLQTTTIADASAPGGTRLRTEEEVTRDLRAGEATRREAAINNVAFGGGLDLSALGATGEDLSRVFQIMSRDGTTLQQMNQRLIQTRRQEAAVIAQNAGDMARAARIRAGLEQDIEEAIRSEVRAREDAIAQSAQSSGARGPNDRQQMDSQQSTMRNLAIITVGSIIADNISAKTSAMGAGVSGAVRGASQSYGITSQLTTELDNVARATANSGSRFTRNLGGLAGKVGGFIKATQWVVVLGQAAVEAYNAIRTYAIELEKNKIEQALDGIGDKFDKLSKDLSNINLRNQIQTDIIDAARAAERLRQKNLDTSTAGLINGFDLLFSSMESAGAGRQSSVRGQVLEKEGIVEYLKLAFGNADAFEGKAAGYARTQGAESAQAFKPVADNVNQLITARIKGGENVNDILAGGAFRDFAASLVYADTALNKQIRAIEVSTRYTEDEKRARIEEIISIQGANKIRTISGTAQREVDQKDLGASISIYTRSLKRMFTNMEQAINAAAYSLRQMTDNIDLASVAIQGQAKVGNIDLETSNVIQNPRSYDKGRVSAAQTSAASLFGSRGADMAKLMNLGETVESTVMSTINKTLESKGPDASNEAIARSVDTAVRDELKGLGLPPELADKLAKEVGSTLTDLRSNRDEKIDFSKLSEKIAGLNSIIDTAKDAQQIAIKALENYQNALNAYTNNVNRIIDLETSARDRQNRAMDITADASLSLAKSLNRTVTVSDAFAKRDASVSRRTGGLTDPTDIFNKIEDLNSTRGIQQDTVRQTAERGPSAAVDFIKFNTELKNTSIALRENKAALEEMANNTTKASAAMDAIQEAQQKAAGRVGFLEKVVTSTPEELESLNQSLYRLQRNANGQQNSIQNSIGAQKAYTEAINNGASATEAMKAAQTAFATERKDTLGTLQDILPFLGNNQEAGNIKANVLESMLKESGMGVSPVFQQILNTLRNPEQDPATASAIQYYNQAIAEQSAATRLLGQLDQNLANDIAQKNTDLLLDGLTKTKLNFENTELSDISKNVNTIVSIIRKDAPAGAGAVPAAPIATGGMVYASAGQFVNFQPQGTDTVPAMLTPGEFVINRRATQANLPLLESINNSYSKGGSVKYYAAGGYVSNYGDAGKMADAGMVTKLPIIDPFPAQNAEIWNIGLGEITKLPNTYTVSYPAAPKNSLPTKRGFALDNGLIQPGRGEVRLGLMPGIAWDGDYTYSYEPMQAWMNKILSPTIVKAKNTDVYLGEQSFGSGKRVSKSEAEKIKERFGSFTSITTPQRKMQYDPVDYDSDLPKASDFNTPRSLGANFWNPNMESPKSYGLKFENALPINTDNPSITDPNAHGYKIWKYQRSWFNPGDLAGSALAVSVNQPEFEDGSPYADRKGSDFKVYTQGADQGIIFPSLTNNDSKGIIRGSKIKESNEINDANYDLYKNTLEFLAGRAEYVDDGSGQGLQKLLAGLYNGTESHITLAGNLLDPFDELKAKGARTAIIAQQTLEQSFRNAAENISSNPRSSSEIKIGLTGGKPAAAKDEVMLDKPFTLKEDVVGAIDKSFPLMINGDMNLLGQDFKEAVAKAAMNKSDKISSKFFTDNLKLTLPIDINGNKPSIDVPISYEEYTGELFDTTTGKLDGKQFQTYLPTNKVSNTLFSKLDTTNRRLFTPKKYGEPELLNAAAGNVDFDAIKDLMNLEINKDPSAEAQRERVAESANLVFTGPKSSLIKYTGMVGEGGANVFTGTSDEPVKVNIGEILLSKLKDARSQLGQASGKVDQSAGTLKKGAVLGDTELRDATSLLIRGSLGIFSRLPMPGYPSNWLYNSGAREALRYATNAVPVRQQSGSNYLGAARHMAGVFNSAGEYLSEAQNRATNVQTYNVLDNVMTMISGAQGAFSAIAGGDTALLKQFYDSKTPIEAVFRSFGAASRFGKVSGMKLSGDWKNTLGNQLSGTRIRTVGRDGRLQDSTVAEAIPESANVTDLMKVLFNPYNEFQKKSSRATLIRKFGDDLFNLRNESGMPYFDKNTLAFIRTGLFRLIDWYGGQGNWVGQDYFFDKTNEPDNAKRMETFLESYKTDGSKLYKDAMEAQTLFGLANAFGPLPTASWFMSRATAEEPQRRATGGIIYAQDGGGPFINFTPRGTDTVPAMLTPGEFVVNRAATQRNLPLLRAMNAGGNVKPYSKGGVAYLAVGSQKPAGFDLGTTTEYRPQNTFGNRSVSTLSKIQYESRYGIPGIRNNIKTISDDQYLFLKSKTEEESRLRKEGTPLLYSDKNTRAKLAKANALKLNKKEYTQLSIGETERFVPFKNRLTREYFPNGADFDSGVFDNTMLDFKDQPVINYLNVDIRTPKQRLEVIKDAIKNKQGFPDLLSKYLLGMQEYEDTWASMGLSMIIDLPNMAAPLTPGDMGIPIASKALSWLSKTKIASVLQNTAKRGRTTLGKLRKLSFGGAEKASEAVPVDELLDPKLVKTITEESDQAATKATTTGKPVAKTVDTATELAEKIQLLRKQWDEVVVSTRQRISDMTASGDSKYLIPENKNAFAAIDKARANLELVQRKIGMIEKAGKDNFDEASRIADEGLDIGRLNKLAENFFQLRGGWDQVPVNKLPKDQLTPQANSLAQKKASGVWSQADQARSDDLAARIQSGGAVFNPPPKPSTLTQAADDAASAGLPKAADDAASAGLPKAADDAAAAKQKSIFGKIWGKLPKKGTIALVAGAAALGKWASKPETQPGPGPRPEDVKPPVEMPDDVAVDPNKGAGGGKGAVGPVVPPIERAAADAAAAGAGASTTTAPDYYDSETYKRFIDNEIHQGKAPTAPDKLKFTTSVVYTKKYTGTDENGYKTYDRYRTTAYDQRQATQNSASGTQAWEATTTGQAAQLQDITDDERADRFTAPDVFMPTGNFGDNAFGPSTPQGTAKERKAEIEKRKAANNSLLQSANIATGEGLMADDGGQFTYDPGRYWATQNKTQAFQIAQKIGIPIENEDQIETLSPEDYRKIYQNASINREKGTSEVTSRSNPRQEYETAYAHFRKILGEYNYHQSIGKGDRYAAGHKTTTTLAGRKMSTGGVVYASTGMMIPYEPRGTDTVPAMLTPGEFVINRAATQKHLPLLTAINSGSAPTALSKGGPVYLENGGEVASIFGTMEAYKPAKMDLGKLRERKREIEQQKTTTQECRSKIAEEERAKESRRLEVLKTGPSDEEVQARQKNEDRRKQAIDARNQAGAKLRELKDSFRKQFYADLQSVKDETGIGSNEEIFKVMPRLHAEFRFISKNNKNWEGIVPDDSFNDFLQQISALKERILEDNWFALNDQAADLTSIEDVSLKPVNDFLAAAGWKEEQRKDPQLNPDKAMSRKDYKQAIANCATAVPKSRGGIIYASEGTLVNYQPVGTDTVPAMLTPGEFVINKAATQKHLPLLNAINSGSYSDGGVAYLSNAGKVAPGAKKAQAAQTSSGGTSFYDQRQQQRAEDYNNTMQSLRDEHGAEQQRRRDAFTAHKEKKIPYAQAYAEQQQANPNAREQAMMQQQQQAQGGGPGGAPGISPQVQQAVGMASQAAFDPSSYGDVNKQMVIFGTLLTGVNQTMVQFGAVLQQLTAGMAGVINGGQQAGQGQQGENKGPQGGIGDFTTKFENLISQLNGLKIPEQININVTHQPLQVNVTGAEAMKALLEGPFQEAVKNAIKQVTTDKNVKNEQSPDE
jgi:TP901 family phage tail tape measure protein